MPEPTPDDPDSLPEFITEAEWDRQLALLRRPRTWHPIARVVGGTSVADLLLPLPTPGNLPTRRVALLMFILLAIKDRASALHFEPDRDEDGAPALRLLIEVDGERYDLLPPPFVVGEPMKREVEALAGYRTYRRRVATNLRRLATPIDGQPIGWGSGRCRLRLGANLLDVELRTYPSDLGNRLFLLLPPISTARSAEAQEQLRRICDHRAVRPRAAPEAEPANG